MSKTALVRLSACFVGALVSCVAVFVGCGGYPPSDCASRGTCTAGEDAASGDAIAVDVVQGSDGPSNQDGGTVDGGGGCTGTTSLECSGACVDPTQPTHCGSCTNVCTSPDTGTGHATCTAGTCGVGCMGATSLDCSGACFDPSSPAHCGNSCTAFTVCPNPTAGTGTPTCTLEADGGGSCGLQCAAPTIDCSGACVDPSLPANCGSACTVCPGPTTGTGAATCTLADGGGTCGVTCSGTTTEECPISAGGTACYALTDVNHCNGCNTVCPGPASGTTNGQAQCSGATPTCSVICNSGYHLCGTPSDCLPNTDEPSSAATDPCILTETFGVFVTPSGTDSATCGSRASPCQTIGNAMDQAKATSLTRVYACGSAGNYTKENLSVGTSRAGLTVYGGLDCTTSPSTWTYNAADKATLAPGSGYALQVSAAVTFEDFAFTAANATAAGASSIAIFASDATGVVLERCNVTAGTGMAGQSATPVAQAAQAPSGLPGGASVNSGGTGAGGGPATNPACPTSIGGAGGSAVATELDGHAGEVGANNAGTSVECNLPPPQGPEGGGVGASASTPGTKGAGAATLATLSSSGLIPTPGQPGGSGTAGQGGGGGGVVAALNAAGGGGGGGAGGCGGAGGGPGSGGGSSIALLAYNSTVNLVTCTLTAAVAGSGGGGAAGQPGQAGGSPGAGNNLDDCSGGAGGSGSAGGPGGGGAGGYSAGVLWSGTAPTITAGSQTAGTAGAAGVNGDGTTTALAGKAGGVVAFP